MGRIWFKLTSHFATSEIFGWSMIFNFKSNKEKYKVKMKRVLTHLLRAISNP